MANTTKAIKLGKALRERRNELELTIKEVARRSGMTDSNVLRIERGDIRLFASECG
jgi:transcriptional regulator with XRE-family HTH domain